MEENGGGGWGGGGHNRTEVSELVNKKLVNGKVFTDFRYYDIRVLKSSPLTKSSTTVMHEINFSVELPI